MYARNSNSSSGGIAGIVTTGTGGIGIENRKTLQEWLKEKWNEQERVSERM